MPIIDPQQPREVYLKAGEMYVTSAPARITTVLGTCVSICLWDRQTRAGGMNHYAAAAWDRRGAPSNKYGDIAIKGLIKKMLQRGSRRDDLRALVFGGGSVIDYIPNFFNIGENNISMALRTLGEERIPIVTRDVGGNLGRKLVFDTSDGSVLVKPVNSIANQLTAIQSEKL